MFQRAQEKVKEWQKEMKMKLLQFTLPLSDQHCRSQERHADIMAIGCKRHEGSAENLEVWDFNGLTEKDGSQLLLGYVREGTERLPRRICLKVDKVWSLCNSL